VYFKFYVSLFSGLREDEEPGERHGVHLAEGEVPQPLVPHEGDVQQL
jgi:hypothetical protein